MTAKDLLIKLLDYQYRWTAPHAVNSKPAKIRRQQIESLQDAFELSKKYVNPLIQLKYTILGSKEKLDRAKYLNSITPIEYLSQGEFIHDRVKEKNKELSERVTDVVRRLDPSAPNHLSTDGIKYMFGDLMRFRRDVYKAALPNPTISEGGTSAWHLYSNYLQGSLKDVIQEHVEEIDEILWMILDPEKRVVDKQALIENFGYPNVNLANIDMEWRAVTEEGPDSD